MTSLPGWWTKANFAAQAIVACKAGLAAVLCLWLAGLLGLEHSYWAAISAIVVMGSNTEVTVTSCRDRLLGTAIGALLGWVTSFVWHGHSLVYGFFVVIVVFICSSLEFDKAGRLAAVALTIVVLVNQGEGDSGRAALARFLEVGLGIIVALLVTVLVFPAAASPERKTGQHRTQ